MISGTSGRFRCLKNRRVRYSASRFASKNHPTASSGTAPILAGLRIEPQRHGFQSLRDGVDGAWDVGAVATILPALAELGIDWSKPLADWPRETMIDFLLRALDLTRNALTARDASGIFVPMIRHRAVLISIAGNHAPIASAQDLLERRTLRVAVVRGFDYGDAYQSMVRELARQGRLFTEVDPTAVARLLNLGAVDVTIMGPTILAGAINREPR